MKHIIIAITTAHVFLMILSISHDLSAQSSSYKVIVNKTNPVSSVEKDALSRYFLKKNTNWSHGPKILPVDQRASSAVRKKFSKDILGRSANAIKSYWQQQIFSGRNVPPPTKSSDSGVIAYVTSHRGAIGYVSSAADTSKVKVIQIR